MIRHLAAALLTFASMLLVPAQAQERSGLQQFIDPHDGQFDLSGWLLDQKGFLPVPLVITEPAVGYGAGVAALFFRESIREREARAGESGRKPPPDVFAVVGAGTENGTRAAAAAGMWSSADDRWRWRGGVARMDVNLDFFGVGGRLDGIGYNLDGWVSVQQGMMRLGRSDTWLVARWNWLDVQNRFNAEDQAGAAVGDIVRTTRASGLGAALEVDTRDNIFTPSSGWKGSFDATWYDPAWGSDTRFQSYRAHAYAYWPLAKSLVLAGRVDGRAANGEAPFYMLPFIELRGLPLLGVQDRRTAVLETVARWNLTPRWALVGFVGGGRAWGTTTDFSEGTDTVSKGVGVRYLIARRLGMYIGIDAAWSRQDRAFYIQLGSAWR